MVLIKNYENYMNYMENDKGMMFEINGNSI